MFSSLRIHGGSNHFFFQTAILQKFFANATEYPPDKSVMGEVFGKLLCFCVTFCEVNDLFGMEGIRIQLNTNH